MELSLRILSSTIGEVGPIGMACLFTLHIANRNVPEDELLATVHVESLSTLRRHLSFCSAHEYASMVKRSARQPALWHITDLGRSLVLRVISLFGLPVGGLPIPAAHPGLISAPDDGDIIGEKNFFSGPSSSSSDQLSQSGSDSDSDQTEEEEREFKKFLCREYGFSGQKMEQVVSDPRVTPELIVGWSLEVGKMKRNKFPFRKTPESYILGCLLRKDGLPPDEPSRDSMYESGRSLDLYWNQFCRMRELAAAENDEEEHHDD